MNPKSLFPRIIGGNGLLYESFSPEGNNNDTIQKDMNKSGKRRKPVKWESWEEKNLIEGVKKYGRGNWSQIHNSMEFKSCRTKVDLHDKWRVITGERKRKSKGQGGKEEEEGYPNDSLLHFPLGNIPNVFNVLNDFEKMPNEVTNLDFALKASDVHFP
jgi:hypothetical protein